VPLVEPRRPIPLPQLRTGPLSVSSRRPTASS